jgi:hypothetical protein
MFFNKYKKLNFIKGLENERLLTIKFSTTSFNANAELN